MDLHHHHHHHHQENSLQPPHFTTTTDAPPPSFTGFTPPQPAAPPSHPPYPEMITAAITSDNTQGKGGGSSKRAIDKYINQVYTNLSPNHSSLLTHYLKELKHNGYLVMVKNSYQLASVVAASNSGAGAAGVGVNPGLAHTGSAPQVVNLDLNTSQQQFQQQQPAGFVDPSPKRRGRPPRVRTELVVGQTQENGAGVGVGGAQSGSGKKRGRPPKQHVIRPHSSQPEHQIMMEPADAPSMQLMPQPESITMDGLGVDDQKRRPGRPSKLTPQRKPAQVNGSAQLVEESNQVVVKRRPGRPPRKNVDGGLEGTIVVASSGSVGRPRGRPKRSALGPVSRPVGKRPRGRPPRASGGGLVAWKRRGRPPKVAGGPPKVKRLSASGKPMGRPRKNAASLKPVFDQMANEELTKKLDLIQSKIRDVIDVLRPYIPHENTPLMALQQLEELVTPTITAPQPAPPVMATPITELPPMPVNMNAPAPTGTMGAPPSEPVTAPYMNVPGPFGVNLPQMTVTEPFQVPSSFDNQQRMSWMSSNEAQP